MIIMLFGVTNVGKTTTGKLLAEKLKYSFFDLDEEVRKYYHTTLEQMNIDYPNDATRHKLKGNVLASIVDKHPSHTVIAVTPLYHTETFEEIIKQDHVIAIELQDTPEHIFDRLVFSDENDVIYHDDEYKNEHKEYYLHDIYGDILFYADVFKDIEMKYFIDNKTPDKVAEELAQIFQP